MPADIRTTPAQPVRLDPQIHLHAPFLHSSNERKIMLPTLFVTLISALASTPPDAKMATQKHYQENGPLILQEFVELLSIPNVGTDLPNINKNALFLCKAFEKRGAKMQLLTSDGIPPIVYGELNAENATRTLGIYVHYDGQPVDPSNWAHPPFSPTLYTKALSEGGIKRPFPNDQETIDPEWRIYARASGDDKAPIQAILSALDGLKSSGIPITSNIRFFFEGEEEMGSPNLASYIEQHRDLLDVDVWLICDGPVHQSRRPQLMFGVRGVTGLDLTVYGANRSLHSGHYGNWAPNPAMLLAQLLASMKDDEGEVLVKGYYDTVTPLDEKDKEALRNLPDYDDQLRAELGLAWTEASGAGYMDRLLLPSLNIKGMKSASVGASARNIIPKTAEAALDLRLVKGNDPSHMMDLVTDHIRSQGFTILTEDPDHATRLAHKKLIKVKRRIGYRAARTPMETPIVQEIVRAANRASGEPVVLLPTLGGSLPLYLFTDELKAPVVIVPIANHDNNQHAPNENLRLANLWYGIDLMGEILTMK